MPLPGPSIFKPSQVVTVDWVIDGCLTQKASVYWLGWTGIIIISCLAWPLGHRVGLRFLCDGCTKHTGIQNVATTKAAQMGLDQWDWNRRWAQKWKPPFSVLGIARKAKLLSSWTSLDSNKSLLLMLLGNIPAFFIKTNTKKLYLNFYFYEIMVLFYLGYHGKLSNGWILHMIPW